VFIFARAEDLVNFSLKAETRLTKGWKMIGQWCLLTFQRASVGVQEHRQ